MRTPRPLALVPIQGVWLMAICENFIHKIHKCQPFAKIFSRKINPLYGIYYVNISWRSMYRYMDKFPMITIHNVMNDMYITQCLQSQWTNMTVMELGPHTLNSFPGNYSPLCTESARWIRTGIRSCMSI